MAERPGTGPAGYESLSGSAGWASRPTARGYPGAKLVRTAVVLARGPERGSFRRPVRGHHRGSLKGCSDDVKQLALRLLEAMERSAALGALGVSQRHDESPGRSLAASFARAHVHAKRKTHEILFCEDSPVLDQRDGISRVAPGMSSKRALTRPAAVHRGFHAAAGVDQRTIGPLTFMELTRRPSDR
jgi:hypothetical protein